MTTTDRWQLRPAVPDDAAALAVFARRCFAETFGGDNRPEDMQVFLDATYGTQQQRAEIENPGWRTVLAIATDGDLLGFAQVRLRSTPPGTSEAAPMEIARFYVDQSAQGSGLAQTLMQQALAVARTQHASGLWLGVWERNARAIAFYRRQGFRDVGSQIFVLGSDRQTDRIMIADVVPV